ncbi:HdeD family acid-resistance protein [Methyloceanibacter marginalis]|uniref:HdeD family acid-resistance protein n=1 Tax=Methyloceanibacter marginalis TaxID=1774971 RepID=UPI0009F200BB|nr:HdeD family acid-resistance protein [Methyloceanibacter marginalis]
MAATTSMERHDALSEVLADSWWAVGLRGLLGVAFGLICLLVPSAAILALILLFSAYMLVDGVLAIASGIKAARNGERWGLLILEGVVDLAAGVIAFVWPAITTVAFVILIAVWAVISGALMLTAALTLKIDHGRWWLALGGIARSSASVLLIAPVVGAVVLTWWLGAYAILFGVMLLVLAFQLHGKKEERETKKPAVRSTTRAPAKKSVRAAAKKA